MCNLDWGHGRQKESAWEWMGGSRSITPKRNVVIFVSSLLNHAGVFLTLRWVRADPPIALARVTGGVPVAALHDFNLMKENTLEHSCNFLHHLNRKPMWQFYWRELLMMPTNMEIIGFTPQDPEQVPADWTAELRHSNCAQIRILYNTLAPGPLWVRDQ